MMCHYAGRIRILWPLLGGTMEGLTGLNFLNVSQLRPGVYIEGLRTSFCNDVAKWKPIYETYFRFVYLYGS